VAEFCAKWEVDRSRNIKVACITGAKGKVSVPMSGDEWR